MELQAPCLSGSVLALLLDYIYTGALPCTCTRQQYYSLLATAHYLQMDKLQEALCAWQHTEVNNADKTDSLTKTEIQPYINLISSHSKTADTFNKYLPLTCSIDACRKHEETDTCSVQSTASSLERNKVEAYNDTQMRSASIDPCIKGAETDACGSSSTTGANGCSRKGATTLRNVNTCSMSESSGNADNGRQVSHLTLQNLAQNISSTTEGYSVSRVHKDMQKDQFHPAGTIKPETWQNRTDEGTRSSSLPSSSSPHPCCGAVPVICHSSRASTLQTAQVSTMPDYHTVSQASVNSSRAPASRSASTENESIVEDITTEHKKHYELEDLGYRNNKDQTGTEDWDSKDSSDQCTSQNLSYKCNTDQSDTLIEESTCNTDHFVKLDDEHVESGISITAHNDHDCDSVHTKNHKKHLRDDSLSKNQVCSSFIGGLKYKTDLSFNDLPFKHQKMNWSDSHDVSMSAAAEERSDDVPLPVEDSDMGSDYSRKDFCPKREAKEERSYSDKCAAEMHTHNSHCNHYGPKIDWYPRLQRAETSTKDVFSSQHEHNSNNKDTGIEDKRHSAGVCLPLSNTPESSLDNVTGGHTIFKRSTSRDLEKISDSETSEPHFTFTIPVDSDMSDSMCSAMGQSYHGHVHYHCIPQEDTHLSHGDSDHKHSHPSYHDHSDQSSEEEETFVSPGHSPLRQNFATGTTDPFLLLDISTKHAELLVSYKHRADQEKKGNGFDRNNTFGTEIRINDREQRNEAGVDARKVRARTKLGAECFDEVRKKSWLRESNAEERKSAGREQSRSRAELKNKAGVVEEASKHEEGENQSSALRVCSAPSVPAAVQTSMSSTCIPPTLPASMSTNISAHLSTPVHHTFQCSLCDRSFSQRGSLNRHVRSHLGVRPFPCPRCPMTFSRQYRVTEHLRVHRRCTLGNDSPHPPASSI